MNKRPGRRAMTRRQWLKFLLAGTASVLLRPTGAAAKLSKLGFKEIAHGRDEGLHLPPGYHAETLLAWGDPLFMDIPGLNVERQSPDLQARQFGYNNDFIAFLPLEDANHGVLVVNHESTVPPLMFPGSPRPGALTREQVDTAIAAHGMSVIEIRREAGQWRPLLSSRYNRRITPWTAMRFSGPAAGHARLRTPRWPDGIGTHGTFSNCSGGVTPWGTILSAEENFDFYFLGDASKTKEAENYQHFGFDPRRRFFQWGRYYPRWDLDKEPGAAMHAGWIVELDPFAPDSVPVKRTALGRFKHENCHIHINADGHVVAYMGDDAYNEYIYRFVSTERFDPKKPYARRDLLDQGTLAVARFEDNGRLTWLPLIAGVKPLDADHGFNNTADLVLDMRKAADLIGATPMDRPEEIQVNPITGTVFVMLTGNPKRFMGQTNAANPRAFNRFGHILELTPPNGDHSAREYQWEIFLLAGDPNSRLDQARYHPKISANGWLSGPDNCAFDAAGRLWIATDGSDMTDFADGLWVTEVHGPERALTRHFMRGPVGAEVTGPCFTPDYRTLFCSIQHPGGYRSRFDSPATRWPDFDPAMPPRPAVIAIQKDDGGVIGS
jgi:secreted PhoX family phosphatase